MVRWFYRLAKFTVVLFKIFENTFLGRLQLQINPRSTRNRQQRPLFSRFILFLKPELLQMVKWVWVKLILHIGSALIAFQFVWTFTAVDDACICAECVNYLQRGFILENWFEAASNILFKTYIQSHYYQKKERRIRRRRRRRDHISSLVTRI